jgi:hypothetical protein
MFISLFGDANSPHERCINLKGSCPAKFAVKINKNNVRIETQHFDDIFDKKYDIPYDPSNPSVAYKNLERAREHVSNTSSLNKNNITIQRYYDKNTGKQIFENIFNN